MNKLFKFENLVGLSALFVAGCAAYYSIIGISTLFSGSFIAAMIMSLSLELGKLVSTSYIFRYWEKTRLYLKIYLISAIIILSLITSMGIFGYLSGAYQTSAIENSISEQKIVVIENQKTYSQNKIDDARKRIAQITELRNQQESRLNQSMTNTLIARNPIQLAQIQQQTQDMIEQSHSDIDNQNQIIQKSIGELQAFDAQVSDIKLKTSGKKDILTFKFVADAIHMDLNNTVKWFIVLLITVFDPLALCLLLAYNTAIFTKEDIKPEIDSNIKKKDKPEEPIIDIPTQTVNSTESEVTASIDSAAPKRKESNNVRGMFHF
jgi:hypothetical protein